ncbi:MAG: hypothetical protein JWM95_4817 [Gemmatimonadetes bacterium]|nr:hypothetical protein [Gemmatimonadota bacterium]
MLIIQPNRYGGVKHPTDNIALIRPPNMHLRFALALSLALLPIRAHAQQNAPAAPPRSMYATRRTTPIAIDGKLDDAAWATAEPSTAFTQSYPQPGAPATDQTQVRILYDDDALYVGIRLFDTHPDSIAAGLARRDADASTGIYTDWVHLVIDSYHDRRTAFRFSTTPRGVKKDVYTFNDGSEDTNWDAVWDVATRVDSLGWVAEYRIPLSQLRFGGDSSSGRVWGLQVQRDIARRNERDSWAPWRQQDGAFVSRFGDLVGLDGIRVPQRLEITPYVSSTVTRAPGDAANPFYDHTSTTPKVGGDLKYGLPGGLTLSATVNPDFGQVEVDPAVVNLSAFETSFPEKRPFFLEGSDVFSFGQVVRQNDYGSNTFLYSRRIGRQPQLGVPGGTLFADVPSQTTIAGAAKVTGKAGPWTVGLLDAVTTEQRAQVLTTAGTQYNRPVEPLSNYFAGRVKRDFRGGATTVGAMLERTSRAVSDTIFAPFLRSNATFGGVDFEHDMAKRTWIASGFLAGSAVQGSQRAIAATQRVSNHYFQRPDAADLGLRYDTTRTSLKGYIGEVALQKQGTNFGSVAIKTSSPGLELNDLGFQSATGYTAISTLMGHQDFTAGAHLRNWNAYVFENDAYNHGGKGIFHGYAGRLNGTFLNLWSASLGVTYTADAFDDQLLRGGPEGKQPALWQYNGSLNTDARRRAVLGANGTYVHDRIGGEYAQTSVSLDIRPSSNVRFNLSPTWTRLFDREQLVRTAVDPLATSTYGRRYVLGTLTQTTLSLDTRMDVTISPTLSFVMYVQPFTSAGSYNDYKELVTPGTYSFARYGSERGTISYNTATSAYTVDPDGSGAAPSFTIAQPNFNVRSLRGNAVARWDYRPGSSLYFVWQQQRSDFAPVGDFDGRRDVGAIFRTVPTNVFLVKATYWIGK